MIEFRDIKGAILGVLFFAFVAWSVYGAAVAIETYAFRMVHVAFILVLGFLAIPFSPKSGKWLAGLDVLLAILGVTAIIYALVDLDQFIRRSTLPETWDMVFGISMILMLVELSRRTVGTAFTLVLVGFLLYACLGNYIPGPLTHKGYDLDRIVGHMTMTLEGILGVPISVSVSFVMLFVVYGVFMDAAGAGRFWLDMSLSVMGRSASSAGRGAVITTALLGGPQASGVATTMSVTPIMWPILRQAGYSADMAAGLISAGGIGAVISPPLMGAGAFLIMQFLKISFWDVVVMVSMPTLLYYMGTLFMVEMEARKMNFKPPEGESQTIGQVMKSKGYHLISLVVLIALLVGWNLSPEMAALGAIATTIAISFLSKDRQEWLVPKKIILATIDGARNMLPVAVLLAAAGLIVGVFSLTGLGLKISSIIMSFHLFRHWPEPADYRHVHHDCRYGRPRPHQSWRSRLRGTSAGLLFRRVVGGFSACWAVTVGRSRGNGGQSLWLDDAGVEVFVACFPGALSLLSNERRCQSAYHRRNAAGFSPGGD